MGVIYSGSMVTPAGRRQVAIKRLANDQIGLNFGDEARARLIAEAQLVFRLTHANICQVLDLGVNEEGVFVVMEFVAGVDLRGLLKRLRTSDAQLPVPVVLHIGREVARALDYAHRSVDDDGRPLLLVHGDVTPQNILISREGEVKLADFGIARALGNHGPGTHLIAGTPGFMAPEVTSAKIDHRADIYSLGMTLYTVLVGRKNAPERSSATELGLRPEISSEFARLLMRSTAERPEDRFVSARDLESALSIELARRHPTFTAAMVADIVRAHTQSQPAKSSGNSLEVTLVSLREQSDSAPTTSEKRHVATQDAPPPRRIRPAIAFAASALLVVVALGATRLLSRTSARAAPATPSTEPNAPTTSANAPTQSGVNVPTTDPPLPKPPSPPSASPAPKSARAGGKLTITSTPWGQIYIDGRRLAEESPVYQLPLPAGRHSVRVFYPDRGEFSAAQTIVLHPGAVRTLGFHR